MGCGGSTQVVPLENDQDALLKNKSIEQEMKQDRDADLKLAKLLLLGAGESGKTTVFKQSHIIYGKGFPDSDRKTYTPIVRRNVITAIKMLCIMAPKYVTTKLAPELDAERKLLEETGEDDLLTLTIATAIKALWADTAIRETFAHRSKFQMSDSSSYFLDKVETLADENYIPNVEDVLRARVPTTGIVEHEFVVGNSTFKMFDVGGQRSERKKWIHCFENVTAVLFVAAMSEYDQVLFEDNVTNRMQEALKLFDETCNSTYLKKVPFILFLNKRDLFAEKIKFAPLSQYFADFDAKGNGQFETCANFLRDKFLSLNKQKGRPMYYHITCATDTNNIRAVFKAVRDIVIRRGLAEAGLME